MDGGLVSEIQRDALDPSVKVSTLLRKVRLAAAKLNLTTVEGWVEKELKGYPDEVPEYRQTRGQVRYWNPHHGWQPVAGDAGNYITKLPKARMAGRVF
jgi:AbiTii